MAIWLRNILVAFTLCTSLPGIVAMSLAGESAAGVDAVDVVDMARRISQRTGRPSVVLLYATTCPLSQQMFPEFVAVFKEYQRRGGDFLVFSTDKAENAYWIPVFLSKHGANFAPVLVRPWAPGSLDRALSPLGIQVGSTWTRPLVAVRDRDGRVIGQSQGVTDLSGVRAALDAVTR